MSWKITTGGSPSAIAGIAPTLDYRFALDRRELDAVTLTDKLTVTRAATAAVNGPTGYLELAGANIARFDHDPTTGESLGLLVEEARKNLLTYSEQFDNAAWSKLGNSITANSIAAPDSTTSADLLTVTSTVVTTRIERAITLPAAGTYSYSVYFKKGNFNWITLILSGLDTSPAGYFDISTGQVGSASGGASGTIQNAGNGWYRCTLIFSTITDLTGTVFIIPAKGDGSLGSEIGNTLYLWGAQLEAGSFPTSYIPTQESTVTRTESATIDGTGVITGTYTMVEKPFGCAVVNGTNIDVQPGYTTERVMVFPAALSSEQITAIRNVM